MPTPLYHDPQGRFTVAVPPKWQVQKTPVGINISDGEGAYASLFLLAGAGQNQALLKQTIDQIGSQWKNFEQGPTGAATLSGKSGFFVFFQGVNPKGVDAMMRVVGVPMGEDAWVLIVSSAQSRLAAVKPSLLLVEKTFTLTGKDVAKDPW